MREYNNRAPDNFYLLLFIYFFEHIVKLSEQHGFFLDKVLKCTDVLVPVQSFSVHKSK